MRGESIMGLRDKLRELTDANFNARNRDDWVAARAATVAPVSKVLDVGAGSCRYRSLFEHCEYETQDFSQYEGSRDGLLQDKWQYGQIDYVCDAMSIPVPDASFDVVLCTEVLEHVLEPIKVIHEIGRILKNEGRLFLTAPLGSGLHQQPYHFYGGYTPHFYHKVLSEAGMEIVSISPNGGFFRHLAQETHRAGAILWNRYPFWHPARWFAAALLRIVLPFWFVRLDDHLMFEEFTVGYHVEAVRRRRRGASQSSGGTSKVENYG